MGKKVTNRNLLGMLAFASLLLSGINYALDLLEVHTGILPTIAYALLLIVVLWTAWEFAKDLSQGWRIIYYIIAILVIAGFVFNMGIKL